MDQNLASITRRLLERLASGAREPLGPSMMPLTTKTEKILENNLANNVRHILEKDFTKANIVWLLSKDR